VLATEHGSRLGEHGRDLKRGRRTDSTIERGTRPGHRPVRVRRRLDAAHGARLLDELRLWIHPFFVGNGNADDLLFAKGPSTQFVLTDSAILKSGMAILSYRLA
jgi:hypothetical protein